MAAIFKCCRNKDCSNVCCFQCLNIFHHSCVAKKKSVIQLEAHKIICSKECERLKNERENTLDNMTLQLDKLSNDVRVRDEAIVRMEEEGEQRISELYDEIRKLTADNEGRVVFIQKLERRSIDFEDEVHSAELKYISEIDGQKIKIVNLNKEILEIVHKNHALKEECEGMKAELEKLRGEIRECDQMRKSMLISIETLTEENYAYVTELKGVRYQNMTLRDKAGRVERQSQDSRLIAESSQSDTTEIAVDVTDGLGHRRPEIVVKLKDKNCAVKDAVVGASVWGGRATDSDFARVLILCDEYGRNLSTLLKRHLVCQGARFRVETIIKPGAGVGGVMEDIKGLTRDFRKTDYVVVFAGSNDFRRRKYPQFRFLVNKIRQCDHTNVVMISVPYFSDGVNPGIYRYNKKLSELVYRMNRYSECFVGYIDYNGNKSVQSAESLVSVKLARLVGSNHSLCKSLIFVELQDKVTSGVKASVPTITPNLQATETPAVADDVIIVEPEVVSIFQQTAETLVNT